MNVEPLIQWGNKIGDFLKKEEEGLDVVKEKLFWMNDYSLQLKEWGNIMTIISHAEDFIRTKGIYANAHVDLEEKLDALNEKNEPFKVKVIDFVKTQASKAKPGECLLGSSEVIESLFGKQKNFQKEQSKSGFTSLLLSLAAVVSKTTAEVVTQALVSVKTRTVNEWNKLYIGNSLQSKRIKFLGTSTTSEQKQSQYLNLGLG